MTKKKSQNSMKMKKNEEKQKMTRNEEKRMTLKKMYARFTFSFTKRRLRHWQNAHCGRSGWEIVGGWKGLGSSSERS